MDREEEKTTRSDSDWAGWKTMLLGAVILGWRAGSAGLAVEEVLLAVDGIRCLCLLRLIWYIYADVISHVAASQTGQGSPNLLFRTR